VAYLRQHARDARLVLHLRAGAELGRHLEHAGSIPLADLIALYKATMPQEPQLHVPEAWAQAERVADELGLSPEGRARLVNYAKERARAYRSRR
jgi:hypothetical protein